MATMSRSIVLGALLATRLVWAESAAAAVSNCLPDGTQAGGAAYRICMPALGQWNGDLVLFAHGYVAFNEPIGIPEDQLMLPDGTSIPGIANALGYAFAVTSYSKNGLAVLEGVADLRDLVTVFTTAVGPPQHVYLVGASEGGIITALAVEQFPDTFAGGLSTCGPIGNFHKQIEYVGDFRVVFDYFFPGLLPGKADEIPAQLIDHWETVYTPLIKAVIAANPDRVAELLAVTRAPVGLDPATVEETVLGVLWYSTFATNDAKQVLGGQPFSNRFRWYSRSANDFLLNLLVDRFDADPAPLVEIQQKYQTTGRLTAPLVTMHTLGDQIIPYWHEPRYAIKTALTGSSPLHDNVPILRYGHCNFKAGEVLFSFALLIARVTGAVPAVVTTPDLASAAP
jgi:pimeloyl-ACP methyl ester carboxylesterase